MKKLLRAFFCFAAMISYGQFAQAALDLELTQGVDGAVPMAVIPFSGNSQFNQELTQVIATDLRNSGHFHILDAKKINATPHSQQEINNNYWRGFDLDSLVVGSVEPASDGKFTVKFQLVNLYSDKHNALLLSKHYTTDKNNFRALAHVIADQIFEKLLGKKGVFSTHIAYVLVSGDSIKNRKYNLMVADIDGHNQQPLVTSAEPIMSPTWSPNGKRIAYVSFEAHKASIYVQTVLTGERKKIADFKGINGAPAWSPDGNKMAVVLSKTGFPKIYLLDINTEKLTQITKGWAIDTEPSFSPDGQSLIFTSNRGGGPQIYRVSVARGRPQRISFDGNYNATASYTNDGKSVVMLHKDSGRFCIAVLSLETGMLDILTDSGDNQSPSVAPNDEMVAFATKYRGRQVLGMVSRDAKIRLRLPAQEGDVREPSWSPA